MSSTKENPCKNFAPNVFNKNKCLNCFKSRDTHLKSDKDLSKAKPIYGGWLLLAPIGTDFNNPAQKNRKWQRRWFILFEHGALRYALDNNETTVAQGTIDMNKCTKVAYAEKVTDQKHSLCITLPEQCYYIRGEFREDIMGWHDQLEEYPKTNLEEMKRKNRWKKRPFETPVSSQPADDLAKKQLHSPSLLRSRNSSSSSVRSPSSEKSDFSSPKILPKRNDVDLILSNPERSSRTDFNLPGDGGKEVTDSSTFSTKLDTSYFIAERKTEPPQSKDNKTDFNQSSAQRLQRNASVSTSSLDSTTSNYSFADSTDGSQFGNSKSKKHLKDYQNVSEMAKGKRLATTHEKEPRKDVDRRNRTRSPGREENERSHLRDKKRSALHSFEASQPDTSNKENDEPSPVLSDSGHADRSGSSTVAVSSPIASPLSTPRDSDRDDKRGRTIARRSTNMKQGTQNEFQPVSASDLRRAKSLDRSAYDMHFTADLFNTKKGWLQRQTSEGNWTKHWFVLAKNQLHYYPDSSSEDNSSPHGTFDLAEFVKVHECEVPRNYGFLIKTAASTFTFSAMTAGIRRNWINAIQKACQPPEKIEDLDFSSTPSTEQKVKDKVESPPPVISTPNTDLNDSSVSERSQRRRARIRDRRKEGRSRTFDFGEIRRVDSEQLRNNKLEKPAKSETKARARTFDPELLLMEVKNSDSSRKSLEEADGTKKSELHHLPDNKHSTRPTTNIRMSIESEWKKVEKTNSLTIDPVPSPSPITKTASMVKALQSEVDSLKLQMERAQNEKRLSSDDVSETDSGTEGFKYPESTTISLQRKIDQQSSQIDKLKQELSLVQETTRKQSSELRERDMQLDISLSEAQLSETQLSKAQKELKLEKSRRDEAEKELNRKTKALNKELEDSESALKKSESLHLDAQRKIRELERQIHMQKDHNSEEKLLQDHIGMLRHQMEEQEVEMKGMQESFEEKCQSQKKLEDRLSEATELIKTYKDELHELKKALKNTDKDANLLAAHRQSAQMEAKRLADDLQVTRRNEKKLKEQIQKLIAQSQIDEDCNKSLQDDLNKEKSANQRLRLMLKEHDEDYTASEKQVMKARTEVEELSRRLEASEEAKFTLQNKCNELGNDIRKCKDELSKATQSEQAMRDRLSAAEKQLREIEEIGSKSSSSTQSSFKAMVSELEAEFGGMGKVIAARLQSLEPSRRVSDPSLNVEKETTSHKIHRLENELENKVKELESSGEQVKLCENKIKEMEKREKETEEQYKSKLLRVQESQRTPTSEFDAKISDYDKTINELESKLAAIQHCLGVLYSRVSDVSDPHRPTAGISLLKSVIGDILKLSSGDTQLSSTPPPSPVEIRSERGEETNQQGDANRLLELVERLKSSDGQLLSPSGFPEQLEESRRSGDFPLEPPILSDDVAGKLYAKQIGIQALLLAEMSVTLRRNQNTAVSSSRSRPGAPPSQLSSGEFSGNKVLLSAPGGLLEHVDALAQKLTLEGVLMREISHLRESWLLNRGRTIGHRSLNSGAQPSSELNNAMVAHAHISYVLQVYNERISRLSLEAKQARHRADAAMRKLRELVKACKEQDLNTISTLAVQVDTDSIASPYSEKPQWEQQVDYGTLHGAHSVSSSSSESSHLDQEATFFQHLADDLTCMSADVQSLSKLGARLVQVDAALHKCLSPSQIGEHASTVAREAIVQAEIIYISHRLRRDYDEELRKAKDAVTEQSRHFESKLKQSEDNWSTKLKRITEEHNAKVSRLVQDVEKMERTRAEMSDNMEQSLTRLSKKQEQKLKDCDVKHEQEKAALRLELTLAKNEFQDKTKDYMREIKSLKEKLKQYEIERLKDITTTKEDCSRDLEAAKSKYHRELESIKKEHSTEVQGLKSEFEKELEEAEKDFFEKLSSIEKAKQAEIDNLHAKHRDSEKTMEKEQREALNKVERDSRSNVESLKHNFDDLLKQEKLKHQMALKNARDDAENAAQNKIKTKVNSLKKEHEKVLERRDKLHQEQLEREKEMWLKECRKQFEAEREVAHSRASSMTSEAESKEALKDQISSLEKQLTSVQGKLETEQHKHDYRSQLNDIKTLCDESFASIESSHAKQLDDLIASHKRELKKLIEEHDNELASSKEDTKKVIDVMRKHHVEELRALREEVRAGSDRNRQPDVDKLKTELETLSEHYSRKCVELAGALEEKEKTEDSLKSLEREIFLLRSRKPRSSENEIHSEVKKLSTSTKEDQEATDLYQLQVMLRVKTSEIDYLKQDVTSLNKQLDEAYQENKHLQTKHKKLFDDLTLSRSKEGMARREASRLKEELKQSGALSDEDQNNEASVSKSRNTSGYDFQKSRSQPDFPSASGKPPLSKTSQPTSSGSSVKRRSSDRSNRYGKLR